MNEDDFWKRMDPGDKRTLLVAGIVVASAFALSSSLPPPLIPAAMESLLFFSAFGAIIIALMRGEQPRAPHLTAWDQAMILILCSIAVGFLVDPVAVEQHLEMARTDAANG